MVTKRIVTPAEQAKAKKLNNAVGNGRTIGDSVKGLAKGVFAKIANVLSAKPQQPQVSHQETAPRVIKVGSPEERRNHARAMKAGL